MRLYLSLTDIANYRDLRITPLFRNYKLRTDVISGKCTSFLGLSSILVRFKYKLVYQHIMLPVLRGQHQQPEFG